MNETYQHLCNHIREISSRNDDEKLKKINEKHSKTFKSLKEFNDYTNELMGKFGLNNPRTEDEQKLLEEKAKSNIINQYEEEKEGIVIGAFTRKATSITPMQFEDDHSIKNPIIKEYYETMIAIFDKDITYENIMRKTSESIEESKEYFNHLYCLIKDNSLDTICNEILKNMENNV